jgi:hypothetical protein
MDGTPSRCNTFLRAGHVSCVNASIRSQYTSQAVQNVRKSYRDYNRCIRLVTVCIVNITHTTKPGTAINGTCCTVAPLCGQRSAHRAVSSPVCCTITSDTLLRRNNKTTALMRIQSQTPDSATFQSQLVSTILDRLSPTPVGADAGAKTGIKVWLPHHWARWSFPYFVTVTASNVRSKHVTTASVAIQWPLAPGPAGRWTAVDSSSFGIQIRMRGVANLQR